MARNKDWIKTMHRTQLLAPGETIQLMDQGEPVSCKVLSCIAVEDGGCFASLEILEGPRAGEKISSKLRAETAAPTPTD